MEQNDKKESIVTSERKSSKTIFTDAEIAKLNLEAKERIKIEIERSGFYEFKKKCGFTNEDYYVSTGIVKSNARLIDL